MVERKELAVCQELQIWFESYGVKCWLNEGDKRFITSGLTKEKPDLVIFSPKTNQYVAIEVKKGDAGRDLYDATKILNYRSQYMSGTKYIIDNSEIKIEFFAVATLQSMFGKLYLNDGEPTSPNDWDSEGNNWKYINKQFGLEPRREYPRTHDYIRHLWGDWRKVRKREYGPGVGIILSDGLNKEHISTQIEAPLLFDMQWETFRKPKWTVRQKWL
jgi:hypothetical protein